MKLPRRMMPRRFSGIVAVTFVALIGVAAGVSVDHLNLFRAIGNRVWMESNRHFCCTICKPGPSTAWWPPFSATLMERFSIRSVATMALVLVSLGTGSDRVYDL